MDETSNAPRSPWIAGGLMAPALPETWWLMRIGDPGTGVGSPPAAYGTEIGTTTRISRGNMPTDTVLWGWFLSIHEILKLVTDQFPSGKITDRAEYPELHLGQ